MLAYILIYACLVATATSAQPKFHGQTQTSTYRRELHLDKPPDPPGTLRAVSGRRLRSGVLAYTPDAKVLMVSGGQDQITIFPRGPLNATVEGWDPKNPMPTFQKAALRLAQEMAGCVLAPNAAPHYLTKAMTDEGETLEAWYAVPCASMTGKTVGTGSLETYDAAREWLANDARMQTLMIEALGAAKMDNLVH